MVRRDMSDEGRTLAFFLKEELPKYRRVLVVSGQMSSDEGGGCSGLSVRQPCGLVDRSARELSVGFGGGTGLRCIIVCSP